MGAALGAPAINTDRIRKSVLGASPTSRLFDGSWAGAYDPTVTERVYDEVGRLAQVVLASGRTLLLDASFRSRASRQRAHAVAENASVAFRFVECRTDPEVCRARLRVRDMTTSVSDGRLEIFDEFLASWEPVDELSADEHVVVDTSRELDECVEAVRARVPAYP